MQEFSPPKIRSRIVAGGNVMNALFMVASSLLLILLYRLGVSIPYIIMLMALLNALVAAYIYTLLPEFLFRFMSWGLAHLIYRLKVRGEENIPHEGAALLICNHVSFIDWLILSAGVGRPIRFVMDHSFFKGFFIKRFMKRAGVIPIAPAKEDPYVLEAAFKQVAQSLNDGHLVCIFPEGKITGSGEMNPFKPGVLRALETTPVPVIPMSLNGMWGSLFSRKDKGLLNKRPRKFWAHIELRIGTPIPAPGVKLEQMRAAVEALKD
jgi:1-acyl-sn-glycerol-3-phosphate acyltransferase